MRKLSFILLVTLFITGCATTEKYEAILSTWVGSTEHDLVRSWGPPVQVYDSGNGVRYLTYFRSRNMYLPGTSPTYTTTMIGGTTYTNSYVGTPAQNIAMHCKTSFEVKDGLIISWRWEGNDCTAQ